VEQLTTVQRVSLDGIVEGKVLETQSKREV